MIRILLTTAFMLSLAACGTTVDDPFLQTGAVKAGGPALATSVPADTALAIVPGLVATSVRQTVGDSQVEQTVLFANTTDLAGENALTITIGKTGKNFRSAPSQGQIEAEMRAAISGVRMRVSSVIADNAYGVFGYATGPLGKSGACVYAWQRAKSIGLNRADGLAGSGYAAQIRLRYCSPSMDEDRIALLMQGLRIKPVSAETFRTLRFAPGSGQLVQAPLSAAQPVMMPVPAEETQDGVAAAPVHRNPRRVVAEEVSPETATAKEKAIAAAVKVPMPGEAAVLAANDTAPAVDQTSVAREVILKPSLVPLPDKVAATAR